MKGFTKLLFIFLVFFLNLNGILMIELQNEIPVEVHFWPEMAEQIDENENKTIEISIDSYYLPKGEYQLYINSDNNKVLDSNPHILLLNSEDILNVKNFTFNIKAKSIGRTFLRWSLIYINDDRIITNGVYLASVVHKDIYLRTIFTIVVFILVMINNINMGSQLNLDVVKHVLKKPTAPFIGLMSQFILMPIGSYLYGKLYFPNNLSWRFGLLTLGCSPGGTLSNFWTLLFDGDVDLSITMTLLSSIAALALMPFWMFVLGREIAVNSNTKIRIPYSHLAFSLIAMTIPLAIGLLIQKYKPNWTETCRKIIRPFTLIFLIIAVGGGLYVNFHLLQFFNWNIIAAGMSTAWTGYIIGALAAVLAKLTVPQVIAVSIETALQNPGVAFVLLNLSLPLPEADLASVPLIGQLMMTGPPLWIIYLLYITVRKLKNNHKIIEDKSRSEAVVNT